MKLGRLLFLWGCATVFLQINSVAQISPGELSAVHKNLEGMANCTKCHSLGDKISGDKCLECHKEIRARIRENHGMHSAQQKKDCITCHKEHRGIDASLLRWEKEKFNHQEAGFVLDGKHQQLRCEQCHTKKNIRDDDILRKDEKFLEKTFLGLRTQCLDCHKDEHRKQLSSQCLDCHTQNQWSGAEKFSHNSSRFKLKGKHNNVQCGKCHDGELREGKFHLVKFKPLQFQQCSDCHSDVHSGKLGANCSNCHSEESFKNIAGGKFDHSKTLFPLLGKHISVKCEQCHQERKNTSTAKNSGKKTALKFAACSDCHKDYHKGDFALRSDKGRCESCHTVDGFTPSKFSMEEHAATKFPLAGKHKNLLCNKCHTKEFAGTEKEHILFLWKELSCTSCHSDIHKGQFAERVKKDGCESCHSTNDWKLLNFAHDKTKFSLKGLHLAVACNECHKIVDLGSNSERIQFADTPLQCFSCHDDIHEKQFLRNEATTVQCEICHSSAGWKKITFDHNTQSRFVLDGKHSQLPCSDCHKLVVENSKQFIRYKPLSPLCESCHAKR
ncbi:MAG: cytochrome c3 family protein [Bacteroidota bacterium]